MLGLAGVVLGTSRRTRRGREVICLGKHVSNVICNNQRYFHCFTASLYLRGYFQ